MTDAGPARSRRPRHAALGGRILAGGISVSTAIVLTTVMAEPAPPPTAGAGETVAQRSDTGARSSASPAVAAAPAGARTTATSRAS